MVGNMMVILVKESSMEKVYLHGETESSMMEIGKTVNNTEKDYLQLQLVKFVKAFGLMV